MLTISNLQQQIDLNSGIITGFEEATLVARSRNNSFVVSYCRKRISRLSKLQKVLKKEIARLIAEQRKEKAYEMAGEGIVQQASRFRRFL